VLIVLAGEADADASRLVAAWEHRDARLLSAASLSQRGWVWRPGSIDASYLVIGGARTPVRAVRGVVSLLPAITPSELPHIVGDEREYVAGEMTAFLVAWLSWLSGLGVRVINKPTPLSLTGPAMQREQWLRAAWQAHLPIERARGALFPVADSISDTTESSERSSPGEGIGRLVPFPVVGGECLPGPDGQHASEPIRRGLSSLAASMGVALLTAAMVESNGQWRFSNAVAAVDVSRVDVADAMLRALRPLG
jgi:hypothetical protein